MVIATQGVTLNNETPPSMFGSVCDPHNIENEPVSVGRIRVDEARADPDIFRKKVDEKIHAILDKYGYTLSITEFFWVNGQVQANIEIVEKPKDSQEQ